MIFVLTLQGLFLTELDVVSLWVSTQGTRHLSVGTVVNSPELLMRRQASSNERSGQEPGVVVIGEAKPRSRCAVK